MEQLQLCFELKSFILKLVGQYVIKVVIQLYFVKIRAVSYNLQTEAQLRILLMQSSLLTLIILLCTLTLSYCQDYVVCYIFDNSLQQDLPNNSVRIYEKLMFNAQVQMNSYTREFYSKADRLKNISDLNSETLLNPSYLGAMNIKRYPIPQYMWIDNKQVVIVEIDLSSFPKNNKELQKYSTLFKHKGQSFYVFNSDQVDPILQKQVADLFALSTDTHQTCQINMMRNSVEENTAQIEECYRNSQKKIVMGKYQPTLWVMILKYGLVGLAYILLCALVACGSPFITIWWHKKSSKNQSHV